MGGFLSGILGGSNPILNKNINQFGQDAGVADNLGTGDATAASKFFQDVLSGDPTKNAEAIAPETSAAQKTAQQQKNQMAQFAPRSGGTAAAAAGMDAETRAQLIRLLGGLKTTAASGAASLGTAEQGLSLEDKSAQDAAAQQRLQNYMNSILGKGIGSAVGAAESYGLGKIFPSSAGASGAGSSSFAPSGAAPDTAMDTSLDGFQLPEEQLQQLQV